MRTHFRLLFFLCSVLVFAGCGAGKGAGGKTKPPQKAPEVGASPVAGPVLLNVAGAGYLIGDVVEIKTELPELSKGHIVLFDWQKASETKGMGPTHEIGEITALPGNELDMSDFQKYVGRDGKEKRAWFVTFQRRGAKNYSGTITLPDGDYLVETESQIMIVDRASIGALVVKRLSHDTQAAKEISRRVY